MGSDTKTPPTAPAAPAPFDPSNPGAMTSLFQALGISSRDLDAATGTNTSAMHQALLDAETKRVAAAKQKEIADQLDAAMHPAVTGAAPKTDNSAAYVGGLANTANSWLPSAALVTALGGGAAAIGGGLLAREETKKGVEAQMSAYDKAIAMGMNPQLAADTFGNVKDDPESIAMRQQALSGLSQRATMGLTPEDQGILQGIQRQASNQFKASNATISQDMARKGMGNSGLALAQSMGAADAAQQQQAINSQNQAAQSFQAKQSALTNLAGQSNTALQSDYTRQSGLASNKSALEQFNAGQKNTASARAAQDTIGKGGAELAAATNRATGTATMAEAAIGAGTGAYTAYQQAQTAKAKADADAKKLADTQAQTAAAAQTNNLKPT